MAQVYVAISYPKAGSQVNGAGNFTAQGFVRPATAGMTAWVVTKDGVVINGAAVVPAPAPFDWAFQFVGVPVNEPVLLVVRGVDGPDTGEAFCPCVCVP